MSKENNALPEVGFDLGALLNKGSNKPRAKIDYLKEGLQSFRILPPISQTNKRLEHSYYLHWLKYADENGNDRTSKVQCTKFSEGHCPLCVAADQVFETIKRIEATDKNDPRLKELYAKKKDLQASASIYLTALNGSNEIVVLQISKTVYGLLEKKIVEAVQQRNFDPTSYKSGVWFNFTKQGTGRESVQVDFRQVGVTVDGEVLYKLDRSPIADDIIARIPNEALDIHDPTKLYIQQNTALELADFLRGVPLPNKWNKKKEGEATQAQTSGYAAQATTASEVMSTMTVTEGSGSNVAAAPVAESRADVTLSPTLAPAAQTSQVIDPLEEARRLRALSQKGGQ